ncbi:hypothetical protein KPATCC21470_0384 [Kitasatospora purpeofusca]
MRATSLGPGGERKSPARARARGAIDRPGVDRRAVALAPRIEEFLAR